MRAREPSHAPPFKKTHVVLRLLLNIAVTLLLLVVIIGFLPALGRVESYADALWIFLILAVLSVVIWPLFTRVSLALLSKIPPIWTLLAFSLISLLLPASLLQIASWLSPSLTVHGFGAALAIAVLMALISLVFASIFAADDESLVYQWLLKKTGAQPPSGADKSKPGLIFLEIDGLGGVVLEQAMKAGKAPNMKRWLDSGTHKMVFWYSDLSSQTSAAQAGILHGNNFGIPAFRWYDKQRRDIIVSSSVRDVGRLEAQISDGHGLLSGGGAARASVFSGDAERVLMTASVAYQASSNDPMAYYAFYLNPFTMFHTLALMVWDWLLEKKAAWGQRLRDEKPRIKRGGIYFLLRSLMTVFARDFALSALRGDMYAGVPYIYVTFAGYDEVAHHSGILRADTLEVLRKLDREFGNLERLMPDAARRYKMVVLSDHGATQGATFRERFGESLEDIVRRLVNEPGKAYHVAGFGARQENVHYVDAAFNDSGLSRSRLGRSIARRLKSNHQYEVGEETGDDIVVLASGNMGLISFTSPPHRLTLEEIMNSYPALLPGLVRHPGVGFVMVNSAKRGALAMGMLGTINLETGAVEGEDPLTVYGSLTRQNLVRENLFPNAPDILVMSTYRTDTDETAAFEELVASHGGAGGEQSRPFILYPADLSAGSGPIIGAEAVFKVFKRWKEAVRKA